MKKKLCRVLGLLLSFTMLSTDLGSIAVSAAGNDSEVVTEAVPGDKEDAEVASENEAKEETASENETDEEESTSENEVNSENSCSENDTDETGGSEDDVYDPVYELLDENSFKLNKCNVEAGSYNATVEVSGEIYDWQYACMSVIYTDKENAEFFPGAEYATPEDLSGYYVTDSKLYSKYKNTDDGVEYYFYLDLVPRYEAETILSPNTSYSYQVVSYINGYDLNTDEYFEKYYFVTEPRSFTTGEALTESQVSINEIVVNDKGYYRENISVSVNNPGKEKIIRMEVAEKSDHDINTNIITALSYDPYNDIYSGCFYKSNKELEIRAVVYTGAGEKTYVKKDITQDFYDDKDIDISVSFNKTGSNLIASGTLTPYYKADEISAKIYYKKASEEYWSNCKSQLVNEDGSFIMALSDGESLEPDTEYQYFMTFEAYIWETVILKTIGSYESPLSFKTVIPKKYTDADFKDKALYYYLKEIYGEANMNSGFFETVTAFDLLYNKNIKEAVKVLDDIPEKLPNLNYLRMDTQYIADISPLLNMKYLRDIRLNYNDITTLPDLSDVKWTYLELYNNPITDSAIADANIPAGVEVTWSYRDDTFNTADTYYTDANGIFPIIFEYYGKKEGRDYSVNITINGITKSYDEWDWVFLIVKTAKEDFKLEEGKTYTARIALNDGSSDFIDEERSFTFESIFKNNKDIYATSSDKYPDFGIDLPFGEYSYSSFDGIYIQKEDKIYYRSHDLYIYNRDLLYDLYEDDFKEAYAITDLKYLSAHATCYFSMVRVPENGDYDIVIDMTNGERMILENKFHLTAKAVLTDIAYCSDRDNSGKYYFIRLIGSNLNEMDVYPVITDAAGTEYTGAVSMTRGGYDLVVCKMEKKDNWAEINKADDYDRYYISFKGDGEKFIDQTSDSQKTLDAYELKERDGIKLNPIHRYYNWKANSFEFVFDSTVKKDTELEFDFYKDEEHNDKIAQAKVKVGENGMVSVSPLTPEGEVYKPEAGVEHTLFYAVKCGDVHFDDDIYVQWFNWHGNPGSSDLNNEYLYINTSDIYLASPAEEIEVTVRATSGRHKTDKLYAKILDTEEEKEFAYSNNGNEDVFETGKWKFSKPLAAREYCIEVYESVDGSETWLGSTYFYVRNKDLFYADYANAYFRSDDKTKAIANVDMPYVDIPKGKSKIDSFIKSNKLDVEVYDADLKLVTKANIKPLYDSCTTKSIYWEISGLDPKEYMYYVRITADGKTPLYPDSDNEVYEDPAHGMPISRSYYCGLDESSDLDAFYRFSTDNSDHAPYTLYFYPLNDPDTLAKTITIKKADIDKNGYYYFSKKDIEELDAKNVYRCLITSAESTVSIYSGYFASVGSDAAYNPDKVVLKVNKKESISAALILNVNGGTTEGDLYTISKNGKSAKMAKLAKRGYTFNGWYVTYTNKKGVEKQKKITSITAKTIKNYANEGILALDAKFTANKYSISYKKTAPAKKVKVKGKIKLAKEEKKLSFEGGMVRAHGEELSAEGYKLIGWTTVKNGTDVMIAVGEEKPVSELIPEKGKKITFYPVWEAVTPAE